MGANLGSLRRRADRNNPQLSPKTSFTKLLKPDCLKTQKRKQPHQEEKETEKVAEVTTSVKRVTLQEWVLASPAVSRDGAVSSINESEALVSKQAYSRISPLMNGGQSPYAEIHGHFSLARDSLSLERRMKFEEATRQGVAPCLSNSQSGKLKKRVRFRLPEETDIIIFYSPEGVLEDSK